MKLYLLPGFGGTQGDWNEFVRAIGEHHNCVYVSYPEEKIVGAVAELIARENEPYALIGYSMGGRIAVAVASALPTGRKPQALVLLASGMNEADQNTRAARLKQDEAWANLLRKDPASFWGDWYAQPLFASMKELPTESLLDWHSRRKSLNPDLLAQQMVEMSPGKQEPLRPRLKTLLEDNISTLYIAGEVDKKYALLGVELAKEFPALVVAQIPGVGHVLPLEAPRECAELVVQFLKKQEKYNGKEYRQEN